jgi:cytosine/adenosine deaminase-related metal-dependent hydrolase
LPLALALGCRDQLRLDAAKSGGGGANGGNAAASRAGTDRTALGGSSEGAPALAGKGGVGDDRVGADRRQPPRIVCDDVVAGPRCSARGDSSRGVRLVGTLLTGENVLERGVLDLDGEGRVRCAACDCGDAGAALVLDCPDWVISPGFINLHDHLGYAGTAPLPHPGELYEHRSDWRLGENGHARLTFSSGASQAEVLAQELRMVLGGATSIVGAGGRRGFLRNLDSAGLSEGIWPGLIRSETFPLDDASRAADSQSCVFGGKPDTRDQAEAAQAYVVHVGEGTSQRATDELRCALGSLDLLTPNSAVVHAMALTRGDAERLAARGTSVVWSPRSNLDLYGRTAPVALLSSLGVNVALGTDWLASGSMNLLRELDCAKRYDAAVLGGYFSAYQLWRMVTENAAWALGLASRFGRLAPGLVGDVAVFASSDADPYASVIGAQPADVRLVLRQGQPLYGDAQLIAAFEAGEACEELAVCGRSQRVCALETGLDLAAIADAGAAVYPLFSCTIPDNEPRCEARVDRECPAGENRCAEPAPPPRWNEADADHDGVADLVDVCPRRPDPDQADADGDGRGDACDACRGHNPGLMPCPVSVASLRSPATRMPLGQAVTLDQLRVSAVRGGSAKGFYAEDGDHRDFSGIFVYTGTTAPKVTAGELIGVSGYFESYRGTDELTQVAVLYRKVTGAYDARPVALGDLAEGSPKADALTSLLVSIENAVVENGNPDAPDDYDETSLEGGLRLDDALFEDLDNAYSAGHRFATLVGIYGAASGYPRLWPRAASDLVP